MPDRDFLGEVKATFGYRGSYNYGAIIEDAVTDCRLMNPLAKTGLGESPESLRVQLGWMHLTRIDPGTLRRSTLVEWAHNAADADSIPPLSDSFTFKIKAWEMFMHDRGLIHVPWICELSGVTIHSVDTQK